MNGFEGVPKPVLCSRCRQEIGRTVSVLDAIEMLRKHRAADHPAVIPAPTPNGLLRVASDFAGGAAMSYPAAARAMFLVFLQITYLRHINPAPEGRRP